MQRPALCRAFLFYGGNIMAGSWWKRCRRLVYRLFPSRKHEDAVLRKLMDEYAESEGARYKAENERLQNDPGAAVPPEVERRAIQLINRCFDERAGMD